MTLRITLRDGEQVVLNGAVIRAKGRCQLQIESPATVMRAREIMSPEEADTPARRLYFACMMAYINADNREAHQQRVLELLRDLMSALQSEEAKANCVRFAEKVALCDFYRALGECRDLINYESEVLARVRKAA